MRKCSSNEHKKVCAHIQYVINHYAKLEYKEMKSVGVTDYTNQTPPMHFGWKKNSKSNNRKK